MNDELASKLPKSVCTECNTNINFIYDYLQKVNATDAKLRALLLSAKSRKFECPECNKTYMKHANFQMHKKSHSSLFCFTCELVFDDKTKKHEHTCMNFSNSNDDEILQEPSDNYTHKTTEQSCTEEEKLKGNKNPQHKFHAYLFLLLLQ